MQFQNVSEHVSHSFRQFHAVSECVYTVGAAICLFVSSLACRCLYTDHLAVVTHPHIAARGGQPSASAAVPAGQQEFGYTRFLV